MAFVSLAVCLRLDWASVRQCHPKRRDREDLLAPRGVDAAVVDDERRHDITLAAILVVVDLDDWYLHTVGHRDEVAFGDRGAIVVDDSDLATRHVDEPVTRDPWRIGVGRASTTTERDRPSHARVFGNDP